MSDFVFQLPEASDMIRSYLIDTIPELCKLPDWTEEYFNGLQWVAATYGSLDEIQGYDEDDFLLEMVVDYLDQFFPFDGGEDDFDWLVIEWYDAV